MKPPSVSFGSQSTTSKDSMAPSCCLRPQMPSASLKHSTARSSRPRTGSFQVMSSARSAMSAPFGPGPATPGLSDRLSPEEHLGASEEGRELAGLLDPPLPHLHAAAAVERAGG